MTLADLLFLERRVSKGFDLLAADPQSWGKLDPEGKAWGEVWQALLRDYERGLDAFGLQHAVGGEWE